VQIKIEAILHCRIVHFGDEAARLSQPCSIDTHAITDGDQFLWRLT
jgi:hypothetical protein